MTKVQTARLAAAVLVLAYAGQCAWLMLRLPMDEEESFYAFPPKVVGIPPASEELEAWASPFVMRLARAVPWWRLGGNPKLWLRLPFAVVGILLAASLWHVARRWYGVEGSLFGLLLFSFSPPAIVSGSRITPAGLAAWGLFGAVFTAVAFAHTLYASPRALGVAARWRNPLLFALALGIGFAAQPWVILGLPFAAAYLFYLSPRDRLSAAFRSLGAASGVAFLISFIASGFSLAPLRRLLPSSVAARRPSELAALLQLAEPGPSLVFTLILGAAIAAWIAWPKARHFGTTAPLLPALTLLFFRPGPALSLISWLPSVVFGAMFIGGVFADLLGSARPRLWLLLFLVLAGAHAVLGWVTICRL